MSWLRAGYPYRPLLALVKDALPPLPSARILGSRVDGVSFAGAQARILALLAQRRFAHIVTFGSEMAMLAAHDEGYRAVVNAADLVVPDTIGIVYAGRLLGSPFPARVAGIELTEALCADCARLRIPIFLLGAAPGVAAEAATRLQCRFPGIPVAGNRDGYFPDEQTVSVIGEIRASGARLLFVALGFPKQELWIHNHARELGELVCIGIGGSLDVFAGRVTRAPALMRGIGMEWFYRLVREPHRLRRQLALPKFAVSVLSQAWYERRNPSGAKTKPRTQ